MYIYLVFTRHKIIILAEKYILVGHYFFRILCLFFFIINFVTE